MLAKPSSLGSDFSELFGENIFFETEFVNGKEVLKTITEKDSKDFVRRTSTFKNGELTQIEIENFDGTIDTLESYNKKLPLIKKRFFSF